MSVVAMKDADMIARMRSVAKMSRRKKGPKCSVCCLPAHVLEAVRQLSGEGLPLTSICTALEADGYTIASYCMTRHFREHE